MHRLIIVVILFLSVFSLRAQTIVDNINSYDTIDYNSVINKFLISNPPSNMNDSIFLESYVYLDNLINQDSNINSFKMVEELVSTNKPIVEVLKLYSFRNKVDSLNTLRYKLLSDYWELEQLKKIAHRIDSVDSERYELLSAYWRRIHSIDTISDTTRVYFSDSLDITSIDSVLLDELDSVTYQRSLNLDSVLKVLNPYNDTLLHAIDMAIENFSNNNMLQWVKYVRNDTINLYLVDVEGDSVLIKLYDNSPDMIRFGITDYWGTDMPAIIRDIDRNSFKILIDDAPEMFYQTYEKAKRAIGAFNEQISSPDTLSINILPIVLQKPKWMFGGNAKLDMSQAGMYQWSQGGDPFVSFLGGLELYASYKNGKKGWENRALFKYGIIRQGKLEKDPNVHIRSNEDRMEVSSKYGYNAFDNYYVALEADSKTQMGPTYDWDGETRGELKTDFMSPAFLAFSLGLDYRPDKNTTILLAPITIKSTIVLDPSAEIKRRYNIDTTANSREEFGARLKGIYTLKVWGDIEIKNTFELFSNYVHNPQNIDVNWEFTTIFPVNDFIKATLSVHVIYDDDTDVPKYRINDIGESEKYDGKGIQLKEMLTIGFFMKF